jgi:hypothetical protein
VSHELAEATPFCGELSEKFGSASKKKIEELVASGMSRKEGCRRFSPRIAEQLNPLWANLPHAAIAHHAINRLRERSAGLVHGTSRRHIASEAAIKMKEDVAFHLEQAETLRSGFALPPKIADVVRIVRKNKAKPEVENTA